MPTQTHQHALSSPIKDNESREYPNQQLTNNGDTRARIALTRPTLLAPVRKHHKSRRLNPTCQPNARQQTQSKPRRHNRPTLQCHGHQRNCRTETCRVFPAPPGVQEPPCPRHHTKLTPLFKQRAAPPMQVNHSVVFTCIGVSLLAV